MKEIVKPLLDWYQTNKRELPWRKDKDPYHIWISEIMLQQTRIEAVKNYYLRFMKDIPNISSLANISEGKLLKYWEGLGYYNRARNLKKAALVIEEKYNGKFPTTYEEIISLQGIGDYTAGAIGSICFSLKEVAIDGNVMRVWMRLLNCKDNIDNLKVRSRIAQEVKEILPKNSGDFNEGIMELGETICLPNGIPRCGECPLKKYCKAYFEGTVLDIPVRKIKAKPKEEQYTVFILIFKNKIAIQKREYGLLQKLWEFPNNLGNISQKEIKERYFKEGIVIKTIKKNIDNKHIFSHRIWKMKSFIIEIDRPIEFYKWVTIDQMKKEYAIATAFQPYVREAEKYLKEV